QTIPGHVLFRRVAARKSRDGGGTRCTGDGGCGQNPWPERLEHGDGARLGLLSSLDLPYTCRCLRSNTRSRVRLPSGPDTGWLMSWSRLERAAARNALAASSGELPSLRRRRAASP